MDYRNILVGAVGDVSSGAVFKRSDVFNYLVGVGYAERTAINILTPSRKGSMIHALLESGAIIKHGPLAYMIVDGEKVSRRDRKNTAASRIIHYQGSPREGYRPLGLMSDPDVYDVEWHLCGLEYESGWNLKLYANGRVPRKANFWLQYRDGKLFGSDAVLLKQHYPDIYENIITDMKEVSCDA